MFICNWQPNPNESIPRHVVQVIPIDLHGRLLTLHRSNAVRSARNVWSFPSELHEIGETTLQAARRALDEELGLWLKNSYLLGQYENIAGDEAEYQYHWVITLFAGVVDDVGKYANKEPDKHDIIATHPIDWLLRVDPKTFHPSLGKVLDYQSHYWYERIKDICLL